MRIATIYTFQPYAQTAGGPLRIQFIPQIENRIE